LGWQMGDGVWGWTGLHAQRPPRLEVAMPGACMTGAGWRRDLRSAAFGVVGQLQRAQSSVAQLRLAAIAQACAAARGRWHARSAMSMFGRPHAFCGGRASGPCALLPGRLAARRSPAVRCGRLSPASTREWITPSTIIAPFCSPMPHFHRLLARLLPSDFLSRVHFAPAPAVRTPVTESLPARHHPLPAAPPLRFCDSASCSNHHRCIRRRGAWLFCYILLGFNVHGSRKCYQDNGIGRSTFNESVFL
jgi:hypothetical protein